MIYSFILPCYQYIGRKRISLNLNWYRNAHYRQLAQIKKAWQPVKDELFIASHIDIKYTFYKGDNRRTDAMNWIAVADKFFLDWLVNHGCIPDDDTKVYTGGMWELAQGKGEHYILAQVDAD